MNDSAILALVQWANSLKGKELQQLPESVREAVIYEQERLEKYRMESTRDKDIINRFPCGTTFDDHLGRKCTVQKHVLDGWGYSVDAHIEGVGVGNFHSSVLAHLQPHREQKMTHEEQMLEYARKYQSDEQGVRIRRGRRHS
jgi:hypothetical protein